MTDAAEGHGDVVFVILVDVHGAGFQGTGHAVGHTDDSGLDILVDPTIDTTLFDIGAMRHELRKLLGVFVDVLPPLKRSVERW